MAVVAYGYGCLKVRRLSPTIIFFVAGLKVHAGNYFAQLMLGRMLGPEMFSDFSAIFGIWLLIEVLTLTVQTVAVSSAAENLRDTTLIRSELNRVNRVVTPILSGSLILASPWLAQGLNLNCGPFPLVLVACCLPFSLSYAVERGVLQGSERLIQLAKSMLCEVVVRLFSTTLMLLLGGGVTAAVFALLTSVLAAHYYTVPSARIRPAGSLSAPTLDLLKTVALSTLALQLLNLSDLLAIKSSFGVREAGYFAGFFLLGKIVLLISSPIYLLLLSRPVQARLAERDPLGELAKLTCAAVVLSSFVALIFSFKPTLALIPLGTDYQHGLSVLLPISWSAVALVAVTSLANYSMAMGYRELAWLALLGGLLQPLVIVLLPATLVGACWTIFGCRVLVIALLLAGVLRRGR